MKRTYLAPLALVLSGCMAEAMAVTETTPISQRSQEGLGNPMLKFGEALGTRTFFETDETLQADRRPILFVWGTGVCVTCAADAWISHWQGNASEYTVDATRGTITDSCAAGAWCGNDGSGAGVPIPAGATVCWRVIRASLQDPDKAGRRDGVCETASGADLSGADKGRPCAADADCRTGSLDNTNVCDTGAGGFYRTTGSYLAGNGTCRGHIES